MVWLVTIMTPVLTYFFWPVSWIPSCFPASPEEILLTPSLSVDPWLITFVPGAVFFKDLFFFHIRRRTIFVFLSWELFTLSPILNGSAVPMAQCLKRELLLENTSILYWTGALGREGYWTVAVDASKNLAVCFVTSWGWVCQCTIPHDLSAQGFEYCWI